MAPPTVPLTSLSYPLNYAASWFFQRYARDSSHYKALRLVRGIPTGMFAIANYSPRDL